MTCSFCFLLWSNTIGRVNNSSEKMFIGLLAPVWSVRGLSGEVWLHFNSCLLDLGGGRTLSRPGTLRVFSGKKEFSLTLSTFNPSQANSWSINRNYFLIKSEPQVSTLFFAPTSTIYHLGDAPEITNIITREPTDGPECQDLSLKIFLSAKTISHYQCDQMLSKHSPRSWILRDSS